MKFPWRSLSGWRRKTGGVRGGVSFDTESVTESQLHRGVKFRIGKISFTRRLELMQLVRDLARRTEFLAAGREPADKMDSALLQAEIDRLYVAWGIKGVEGLMVDGATAGPESLDSGPEDLFREALAAVRKEIGLSAEERKNC